jgi:transcriptional regulator with XRE-family HTH domain
MNDLRVGAAIRAERRRRGFRQRDVAELAGVSQQTVSRLELGGLDRLTIRVVRSMCRVLQVDVEFLLRSRGPNLDALVDARHAELVAAVVARLGEEWTVITEFSFSEYGERGSVDVLAWRAASASLALIEVKSELDDIQAVLRSLDVKARLVPQVLARTRGWRAASIASVLVLPDESGTRRAIGRHEAIFARALPARTVEVRRWIEAPAGPLHGIWFLASTPDRRARRNSGSRGRVRPLKNRPLAHRPSASRHPGDATKSPASP